MVLTACGSAAEIGQPLREMGVYNFPDGYALKIENNDGVIKYRLFDSRRTEVFASHNSASAYQGWMLVWDGNYLWFASSDIGGSVWGVDENGTFLERDINASGSLRGAAPKAIIDFLRGSTSPRN